MERVALFDVDGTLTAAGTSSSGTFLAHLKRDAERGTAAESADARGEMTDHQVCDVDAVVEHCHRRDWLPVLSSLAWTTVTGHLARRFGSTPSRGSELEVVGGPFIGRVREHWDERDKDNAALAVAARHGVAPSGCLAIGDSRSDLPLFATVKVSVALNTAGR